MTASKQIKDNAENQRRVRAKYRLPGHYMLMGEEIWRITGKCFKCKKPLFATSGMCYRCATGREPKRPQAVVIELTQEDIDEDLRVRGIAPPEKGERLRPEVGFAANR